MSKTYAFLALILLTALGVRLYALHSYHKSVYSDFLLWDEQSAHAYAMEMAKGEQNKIEYHGTGKLPVLIMGFMYKIFSPRTDVIRMVHILLGVMTCFFIFLIGKELGSEKTGLMACAVAALYKPFLFYNITLLKTSVACFVLSAVIYMFLLFIKKESIAKSVFMGLLAGLFTQIRPEAILLWPLFMLMPFTLIDRSLKQKTVLAGVIFLGLFLCYAPFLIGNNKKTKNQILGKPVFGIAFYLGNQPGNNTPYYRPVPFAKPVPRFQVAQFIVEASKRTSQKLGFKGTSAFWTKTTLTLIKENPFCFIKKLFIKGLAVFHSFEACDHYGLSFLKSHMSFLKIPFIPFALVMPFAIAGFLLLFKTHKTHKLSSVMLLASIVPFIVFFPNARFRLPLMCLLIPYAVLSGQKTYDWIKRKEYKNLIVILTLISVLTITEFLPIKGTADMSGYHNTHAMLLQSKGRVQDSLAYSKKSLALGGGYSDYAAARLSAYYLRQGKIPETIRYAMQIKDTSIAVCDKYNVLAELWTKSGKTSKAILLYEKSLQINAGQLAVWNRLQSLYEQAGQKEQAKKANKTIDYLRKLYLL